MNHRSPPFDPPYVTTHRTDEGEQHVETLADGTTRPYALPAKAKSNRNAGDEVKPKKFGRKSMAKVRQPSPDNPQALMFLKVPFAEKDQAKRLGARWDAERKQWYVPQGRDVNLFNRWWPEALKDVMS